MTSPPRGPVSARTQDHQPASHSPARNAAGSGRRATRWPSDWLGLAAISATGLSGLLLFLLPLPGVTVTSMNGLGLVSVLPVASLVGIALLVGAFTAMLALRRPVPLMLGAMIVAIVFCLDGVTSIIEPVPRFATSYQVAGFVSYISHTGHAAPGAAAYFSWPGFFALIAFAARAAGARSLLPLLTWWPVVIDLLLLVPFMLLTRALRISWRARWLAALLFCTGNWVGQDYFSPQSLNFLFYLSFIAIVLTWFSGRLVPEAGGGGSGGGLASATAEVAGRARPKRTPGELPSRQVTTGQRALLLLVLIAIFAASTVSHQLSPAFILVACAGLVLVGRCTPRGLPILLGVLLVGWISYETVSYWSGHLSTIFGGVGGLRGTVSSSVGHRLIGTPLHRIAIFSRVVLALIMALLVAGGLLRRLRRRITDRAMIVLLVVPLIIIGLQNYGGEIALRVYMFMLPAVAVLAAVLFFPGTGSAPVTESEPRGLAEARDQIPPGGAEVAADQCPARPPHTSRPASPSRPAEPRRAVRSVIAAVLAGVVAVLLAESFLVARYGNEAFERTPPDELAAMNYIYSHARGGTSIVWLSRPAGAQATPQMPWAFRDIVSVNFLSILAPENPADTAGVATYLRHQGRGAYLIITGTETTFIRQVSGYPPDWERRFRAAMKGRPGIRLVFSSRNAAVYQAQVPASSPRARSHVHVAGPALRSTPWSLIGLVALFAALVLLSAREFVRECLPARRSLMRPLALASAPAVALLLIAVLVRFRTLSLPVRCSFQRIRAI